MKVLFASLVILFFDFLNLNAQTVIRANCAPYENVKRIESTLSCNNKNTNFRFINGVNTSRTNAQKGLDNLIFLGVEDFIHSKKDNANLLLDKRIIYNNSFVPDEGEGDSIDDGIGLYKDIVEAMAQKLMTDFGIPENSAWQISFNVLYNGPKTALETLIARMIPVTTPLLAFYEYFLGAEEFENFKSSIIAFNRIDTLSIKRNILISLTAKKKMIVVTHSQGGLFLNQAWQELTAENRPEFVTGKKWFTNLQIATPASSNFPNKGGFLTNLSDFAAALALRSNMTAARDFPNPPGIGYDDLILSHNLIPTYLNPNYPGYRDCAANAIIDAAEQLESNCTEQCTDPETQAVYEARRHTNPDGKEGGLVSIDSIVDSSVHIDPLSVVCGISNVSGEVSLWGKTTVINSVLNGRDGGVFVDGGDTPVHEIPVVPSPVINPSPVPNVYVRNANLEGNIYLLGKVRVLNSKLDGKSSGVYVYGGSSPNPGLPVPSPSGEDFNGWSEFNVTIDESEVLASEGIGIDIVNSYVYKGKVQDEAFLLSAVLNNAQIKNFASIEGGEADAFSGEDIGLPAPELIISGDSIVKGTVVTQTKTHIESSLIDKKGIVSGNAIIRSSQVSGQVLAYDDAVASTERPMAEVVNSRLEEMGIVFNSGKMLFGALIGHRNDPAQMVGQSFIFDKAILANGAAFTDGAYISESAYVGGNKVFMTRTHVFGNARVNSNEGGGTAPNSAIHESRIHDQAQVLGSPFVKQSAIFGNAIVKNNAQVIKSMVGSGFVLDGEFRFICSQLELPFLEDPVKEEDCSNPLIPTAPAPASAARSIASVSPAEIENDEIIHNKLGREKSRATMCSQRIKGAREKSVYGKVVKKIEDAEAKLSNQLSLKKRSNGKRISSKELEKMNDSFKKQKNSKAISLAKANKKDLRDRFNKFKKKWMKKKI